MKVNQLMVPVAMQGSPAYHTNMPLLYALRRSHLLGPQTSSFQLPALRTSVPPTGYQARVQSAFADHYHTHQQSFQLYGTDLEAVQWNSFPPWLLHAAMELERIQNVWRKPARQGAEAHLPSLSRTFVGTSSIMKQRLDACDQDTGTYGLRPQFCR